MRTDRLTRRYGERPVADAVDLTVGRGEVCGFLGPAGLPLLSAVTPAALHRTTTVRRYS